MSRPAFLDKRKFEAVIVDLQLGDEAVLVLRQLRLSRANRTAVTFAITTGNGAQTSGRPDSTFVLQRPLSSAAINLTLRAAFGLIVRERRRYFRCPVVVPAFLRARQPEDLLCQTVNISEGGIAIQVPADLPFQFSRIRALQPPRMHQPVIRRNQSGLAGARRSCRTGISILGCTAKVGAAGMAGPQAR